MKKTFVMSVMALIASAALASASATNWIMTVKASDMDGKRFDGCLTIGTFSGYTDGLDSTKGEPGTIAPLGPGMTMAVAATRIPGAAKEGILDLRDPLRIGEMHIWEVHLYTLTNGGPAIDKIKITITPGVSTNAPAYTVNNIPVDYGFFGSMVPGGFLRYSAASPMPSSFSFIVDNPGTSFDTASILTIKSPVLPEPSGVLALFSGVAGLAGFAWRRRR